ncbi:hypothetical protein Lal_00015168, partial [Lupinus albus]
CPTLKKKDSYSKNFNNNKVNNYNDISSSSDSDNEENAQIALMASHQSEDELDEVSNSFELHSYDELQEAYNELHDEFLKLSKICSKQKKTIVELESKVNSENKLTSCNKCIEKESKIHELTNEINTLNRSTKNLDKILLNQRPSNNKRGIGYSPNNNSGENKTVFIKESISTLPPKFSFILPKDGFVTYGDNNKGKILGIGRIGKPPHVIIDNVLYVDGLKQNILSMRSTM